MENIIKVALATRFKQEDIDNIMFIAVGTGNVEVACEMLLGTYEQPYYPEVVVDSDNRANRVAIAFDPFKEEVEYKYNSITIKRGWVKKDVMDKEDFEENKEKYVFSTKTWKDDVAREFKITEEELEETSKLIELSREISDKTNNATMSLSQWNKLDTYALAE